MSTNPKYTDPIYTWVINSYKCLPYLKLAVESIRQNAWYPNQPIIIYTENDPETAEWIQAQPDVEAIVETNAIPLGIGGGVNRCVERVKTEFFSLIHSDMVISKQYDKPLYEIVSATESPLVAGAWRVEPNIWNQPTRMGTIMAPANTVDGLGTYHHDFNWDGFMEYADQVVSSGELIDFRKVEGVSYMMRTKYFLPNSDAYRPTSFEDHDQSVRMQIEGYDFTISGKAIVWHFGSRSSIFLGQLDQLTGRSDRQVECERKNMEKWVKIWNGERPSFDSVGFIRATGTMLDVYMKNREEYKMGNYTNALK